MFMPLGLYCMVLIYKDNQGSSQDSGFGFETISLQTAKQVSKWGLPQRPEDKENNKSTRLKVTRPLRSSSGATHASNTPMQVAPLVYPGLDDMIERPEIKGDESFKERLLRNKDFVQDYFDRRASANYAGNNPDSALKKTASQAPEFHTRFADPNHPCNNGHLVSLVTGGNLVAQPRGRRNRLREVGDDGKLKPAMKGNNRRIGLQKLFAPNILYLTIVNLPTEEELEDARLALGLEKTGMKDMQRTMAQR
jgi:hypothetical protein